MMLLNRGLEPARWYLLVQLFHHLLSWAWWYLYSRKHDDTWEFFCSNLAADASTPNTDLPAITTECNSAQEANPINADDIFVGEETRDILTRRERVRAKKAGQWIASPSMVPSLAKVIVATTPNESYLHFLLKEHSESTWTGQYGLQHIPCVSLCQPWKSPAFQALDKLWLLQTSPIDNALEVLAGWPGIDWNEEQSSLFQLLVDMSSCAWKRLARKHLYYPWKLAMVLDAECPRHVKTACLEDFFGKNMCCLEPGACQDLHKKFSEFEVDHCLSTGSDFMRAALLAFSSRTTNVQLENDFSRATSSRAYLRGKRHSASTMTCKHVLAEIKKQHLATLEMDSEAKRRASKRSVRRANIFDEAFSLPVSNMLASEVTGVSSTLAPTTRSEGMVHLIKKKDNFKKSKESTKVNGWSCCLAWYFQEPSRPGESRQDRYRRIRKQASDAFKDPAVKAEFREKALKMNKGFKVKQKAKESSKSDSCLLDFLSADSVHTGIGPWGIGDAEFAVGQEIIKSNLETKNFIQAKSKSFCES